MLTINKHKLAKLDVAIEWVNDNLFYGRGLNWAQKAARRGNIQDGFDFLHLVNTKWPGLIIMNDETKVIDELATLVDERFLLSTGPTLFPYLLYHTFLGRNPTDDELETALKVDTRVKRKALIRAVAGLQSSTSKPAVRLLDETIADRVFRAYRIGSETLLCKEPAAIPEKFFSVAEDDDNATAIGISCFEYNSNLKRIVKHPGMTLLGHSQGANVQIYPGWIFFGPKIDMPAGTYRIDLDIAVESEANLLFDLVANNGTSTYLSMKFRHALKTTLTIHFEEAVHSVEMRLLNLDQTNDRIELRHVSLMQDDGMGVLLTPSEEMDEKESSITEDLFSVIDAKLPPSAAKGKREPSVVPDHIMSPSALSKFMDLFGIGKTGRIYNFIDQTGEFNRSWYLSNNLDVQATGIDPLRHYIKFGYKEGRWPNPDFDPVKYQDKNASEEAKEFAFLHYLREKYGK